MCPIRNDVSFMDLQFLLLQMFGLYLNSLEVTVI